MKLSEKDKIKEKQYLLSDGQKILCKVISELNIKYLDDGE